MRGRWAGLTLLAALVACGTPASAAQAQAQAQVPAAAVATSPRPDRVAVTIYRAPDGGSGRELSLDWLEGFALVSETRTVTIGPGETELRFEGVAGGIMPQSAIVTGLPEGVLEKNHDAFLLSPASLLDRSLGRRVHLRRTSRATGRVVEQEAVIRSGAGGAVVLQTAEGFEALRCTGLAETPLYPGVPAGLASRPTLSVRAQSDRMVTTTFTLSYLAIGFDWQANYVLNLSPDGREADMFAWLTLASSDETSFADADTQAVAGRLNRAPGDEDELDEDGPPEPDLDLTCWPSSRTSDVPPAIVQNEEFTLSGAINVEQVINGLPQVFSEDEQDIVVTASRMVRQEELGDVKLYRLPERVTIASNSQKQVALLRQPGVRVRSVYRARIDADDWERGIAARRVLVTRNRTEEGLGLPLPAGRMVVFGAGRERPLLLGEGEMRDRAVGEDIEIELDDAPGIVARTEEPEDADDEDDLDVTHHVLTVSNDRPYPIDYEAEFLVEEDERFRSRTRLGLRNGRPLWRVTVPANGEARLRYRIREIGLEDEQGEDD